MDIDLFQPDDIPLQEGERTLICSCPKCSAKIELDFARISKDTYTNNCTSCKTRYVLTRESFARRASRKADQINCASCGGQLDHFQYCPSCKTLYPDYFAAELPDAIKKRSRQNRDLFGGLKNFSFEWRSSSTPSMVYTPAIMDSEPWQDSATGWKKKNMVMGASALVIIALIAFGLSFYNNAKAKKQYAASYVMALYGIKAGTDLGLTMCGKISSEWTAKASSGQSSPPLGTVDDENQLNQIKAQTDKFLQKLNDPPAAFADSNEKLLKLNGLFMKLHAAALKPSGSVTNFVELTQKTGSDFKVATEDLKKTLPAELSAELAIAKAKYRGMKDF